MTRKSFFHDEKRTFLFFPSCLIASFLSSFSPFPGPPTVSPFLGRIPKHTDSLFRSSFHVAFAFAFVKFLGRKMDGEATELGSRQVEKLWPRCETSVALFSARMSLPNSWNSFFSFKQDCEREIVLLLLHLWYYTFKAVLSVTTVNI